MEKVYCVFKVTEYDYEFNRDLDKIFSSEKKAQDFIEWQTARAGRLKAVTAKLDEKVNTWTEINPQPVYPKFPKRTPWPSGLKQNQITQEMRDLRDEENAAVECIRAVFREEGREWITRSWNYRMFILDTLKDELQGDEYELLNKKEDGYHIAYTKTTYEIRETEVD